MDLRAYYEKLGAAARLDEERASKIVQARCREPNRCFARCPTEGFKSLRNWYRPARRAAAA
ncbi:MAG: hypothetical protein AB7P40_25690 [Chloroflexota bacterium]